MHSLILFFYFYFLDTKLLLEELNNLKEEIVDSKHRLSRMEFMLEGVMTKLGSKSKRGFIIDKELNVPFKNMDQFLEFNNKLTTNQQFRLDFVSFLFIILYE